MQHALSPRTKRPPNTSKMTASANTQITSLVTRRSAGISNACKKLKVSTNYTILQYTCTYSCYLHVDLSSKYLEILECLRKASDAKIANLSIPSRLHQIIPWRYSPASDHRIFECITDRSRIYAVSTSIDGTERITHS
jgi:hypothetical protein